MIFLHDLEGLPHISKSICAKHLNTNYPSLALKLAIFNVFHRSITDVSCIPRILYPPPPPGVKAASWRYSGAADFNRQPGESQLPFLRCPPEQNDNVGAQSVRNHHCTASSFWSIIL